MIARGIRLSGEGVKLTFGARHSRSIAFGRGASALSQPLLDVGVATHGRVGRCGLLGG